MMLVLETEAWRNHALQILEIVYEDAEKRGEYEQISEAINKKYDEVQQSLIRLIKERLPYEVPYSTLKESEKYLQKDFKSFRREENGG
jgi:hypothetical protein